MVWFTLACVALGSVSLLLLAIDSERTPKAIEAQRQRALAESWHEVNAHRRLAEWNRGELPTGWRAEYRPAASARDADDHEADCRIARWNGRMAPAPRPVGQRD